MIGSPGAWVVAALAAMAIVVTTQSASRAVTAPSQSALITWLTDRYTWVVVVLLALIAFGMRPYHFGTDTLTYVLQFQELSYLSYGDAMHVRPDSEGRLFNLMTRTLVEFVSVRGVFVFYSLIFAISFIYASRKLCGDAYWIAIVLFFTSFAAYGLGFNIIRASIAASLLLIAFSLYTTGRWKVSIAFAVAALLVHTTSAIAIIAFFLALALSLRGALIGWVAAIVLTYLSLDFAALAAALYTEVKAWGMPGWMQFYLLYPDGRYDISFRWDFLLYSLLPVLIIGALWYVSKINPDSILLRFYIIANAIFVMSFGMMYSDRVGLYSWIVIPFILTEALRDRRLSRLESIIWFSGAAVYVFVNVAIILRYMQ